MTLVDKNNYTCPSCNSAFKLNVYSSVNVSVTPHLKKLVLDDLINVYKCSNCRNNIVINQPFLYNDSQNNLIIWYIPDHISPAECLESASLVSLFGKNILRYVKTRSELIEKIRTFDHELNDIVIQVIKSQILADKYVHKGNRVNDVYFVNRRGSDLNFLAIYNNSTQQTVSTNYDHYWQLYKRCEQMNILNTEETEFIYVDYQYINELVNR